MYIIYTVREVQISIHALREEGDGVYHLHRPGSADFYPRPPRGGRQPVTLRCCSRSQFLSTPSARRATYTLMYEPEKNTISIHALREEGDIGISRYQFSAK